MSARRSRRTTSVLAVSALLIAIAGGAAQADDISNNLDTSVDAVAEVMALNVGGGNGTTTFYVSQTERLQLPGSRDPHRRSHVEQHGRCDRQPLCAHLRLLR